MNDWSIGDLLCAAPASCDSHQGNQVGWWQTILWADGFLNKCGGQGVDGIFGAYTKQQTTAWQSLYGGSGGAVGSQTRAAAREFVVYDSSDPPRYFFHYIGAATRYPKYVKWSDSDPHVWYFSPAADPLASYTTNHSTFAFTTC